MVKEKAKTLTTSRNVSKSTTAASRAESAPTTAKSVTKPEGSKAKSSEGKSAPVEAKRGRGRPKKETTAAKGIEEKKAKKPQVISPVEIEEEELGEGRADLESVETDLPDDIDAELDIEVETDAEITLDSLTTGLDDVTDPLDVDDLADDFDDDDEFSEDSAEEAEEDLDLTEDLSEELGTDKFFRDTETHHEDDEEEIPRSW